MKRVLTARAFVPVGNEESISFRKSTFSQTLAILYTLTNEMIAKVTASLFPPPPEKQCIAGRERLDKNIVVTAKTIVTERFLKFRLSWEQDLDSCNNLTPAAVHAPNAAIVCKTGQLYRSVLTATFCLGRKNV
jgi:hypothetical protein